MSFAMTTPQVRAQEKDVTRRMGWKFLLDYDLANKPLFVQPVVKGMGLKKGEKIERIGPPVRIIRATREPLDTITQKDCKREGFPELTPGQFVDMLVKHYGCKRDVEVTRIVFIYTGG
jgi:hypothetical protein